MRRTDLGYLPVNLNLSIVGANLSRAKNIVGSLGRVCREVPNYGGRIIERENGNEKERPGFHCECPRVVIEIRREQNLKPRAWEKARIKSAVLELAEGCGHLVDARSFGIGMARQNAGLRGNDKPDHREQRQDDG